MLTLFKTKYKVRVCYKSGSYVDQWYTAFTLNSPHAARKAEWVSAGTSRPIFMNLDEVESIWQVSCRINVFTYMKLLLKRKL